MKKYFNKELLNCLVLKSGKTDKEIVEELKISYSTLWGWRGGEFRPWNRNLKKLADYFGVNVNCFFKPCDDDDYNKELRKVYMRGIV